MNKPLKLSHSSIQKYLECSAKFDIYYNKRIRTKALKSALIFGGTLDVSLNLLFEGKSLEEAKEAFYNAWKKYYDNKNVIYSKSDLVPELLEYYKNTNSSNPSWTSLKFKGLLMLEAAEREILPKIKEVLAIQKPVILKNSSGDEINGFLDLIVINKKNDQTYLMDNKSSSIKYSDDSPKNSQQLVIYYYCEKNTIKIDKVGFFVYNKKINLNKVKTCNKCKEINKGFHKSCPEISNEIRCHGDFQVTYNPIGEVQIVTSEIALEDEERVLNDIDTATHGIANEQFDCDFNKCETKFGRCEYWQYCRNGSMEGLIKLPDKKK